MAERQAAGTLAHEFNSSDIEFEEQPAHLKKSARPIGQKSIAQIIDSAEADRLSSKRTTKQLEFGHETPDTRYFYQLWV